MGFSSPDTPAAPDPAASYQKGIDVFLSNLPRLLGAESSARDTQDPANIERVLNEQNTFGPALYDSQLAAYRQIDPFGAAVHDATGASVLSDLYAGRNAPPDVTQQWDNYIRGRQVLTGGGGSSGGNAPVSAEALYKGQEAEKWYQQHLDNAGQFLGLPSVAGQISQITPVSSITDRSFQYANPNAGYLGQNFALSNYGNQLTQSQAQGNPWARAATGAAQGAVAGGGGWGSVIGAVLGGAGGYAQGGGWG